MGEVVAASGLDAENAEHSAAFALGQRLVLAIDVRKNAVICGFIL
jgi:hypothetical protein